MKLDAEEFEQWRSNPITQKVRKAARATAEEAKAAWISHSWENGICDPVMLADLRATARVAADFADLKFEDVEAKLGEE